MAEEEEEVVVEEEEEEEERGGARPSRVAVAPKRLRLSSSRRLCLTRESSRPTWPQSSLHRPYGAARGGDAIEGVDTATKALLSSDDPGLLAFKLKQSAHHNACEALIIFRWVTSSATLQGVQSTNHARSAIS